LNHYYYLSSSQNSYYEWRFGKIKYSKKGSGSPVILLHDLTCGSSDYEYHYIYNALSQTNEVYSLNLLGYGSSDKPDITYTNYLYVQLLIDFIKNIVGKKATVIATGDSAPIAIMAGHNDPEAIDKMIFINPQSLYLLNQIPSKQTKTLKFLIETPVLGTFIYNILSSRSTINKAFREEYYYNPERIKEEEINTYLETAHLQDKKSNSDSAKYAFASYTGKYMNSNILHSLKEINHSIYLIAGEEEKDIHTTVDNYKYYNNNIESYFIPNSKHLPHLEKPEEVIKQIEIFLS
jgi:pimeloyl-ACP methyl ester carboxylesterase